MKKEKTLEIGKFYPDSLEIIKITETEQQIKIETKSKTHGEKCPKCGEEMKKYHGTYERWAQDLPILGKNVELKIVSYEYYCESAGCGQKVFLAAKSNRKKFEERGRRKKSRRKAMETMTKN